MLSQEEEDGIPYRMKNPMDVTNSRYKQLLFMSNNDILLLIAGRRREVFNRHL